MWEQLVKAINNGNEKEALRLIDQMKPEDFHLDQALGDDFLSSRGIKAQGCTILHAIAIMGYEAALDKLLSINPNSINVIDHEGRTLLHYAANSHNTIVDKLLAINPKLAETIDNEGYTALHYAAIIPGIERMKELFYVGFGHLTVGDLAIADYNGKFYGILGCFSPKMIQLHSTLGYYSELQNHLNKCIKNLTELIKNYPNSPNNANYQYKLGNMLLGLGRKEEGMKAYEEALKLDYAKYHEKINNNLNDDEQLVLKQGTTLKDGSVIKPLEKEAAASSNENNNELNKETKRKVESIKRKVEADIKSDIERAIVEINELEQKLKLDMEKINQKRTELEKELQLLKSYEADITTENSKLKASVTDPEELKQDNNDGASTIKQAKVENNTNSSNKGALSNLKEKLPLATTSFAEKTNLMIANKKAKAKLEKASANKVKKQIVASLTLYSTTDDTKEKETINTKTDKAATESLHGVPASYSNERISKLLNALEKQDILASIIDIETGKLAKDRIESLIKPVMEEGKMASIALHLRGECWASLIIKKQGDNLQVIYNDPKGNGIKDEKNVKSLINTIKNLEEVSISTYDLMVKQQLTDSDSAALVIDNLTTLAKANTSGLKKPAIQKLLAKQDQINEIKSNHSIMLDDNPWYGDSKIDKLLQLKLAGQEEISIAPSVEFERKELLVENVSVAAKEVMDSGKIALMPIHLHGNHWTALVIKKQTDDSLQILYNDPKGNSLMSEKNSGALIKAISKINAEFTVIDIRLKQQDNDDDGGPYTLENLIKLATEDTSSLHKNQLQKLLQPNNNFDAVAIRALHADALNKAGIGIAVVMPKYSNNDKVEEISQFAVVKENIDGADTKVDFLPPSPVNETYETEAIGVDSNH